MRRSAATPKSPRLLSARESTTADDAAPSSRDLVADLRISALRAYGITSSHIPALVDQAARASSMKANPLPLTPDELTEIITRALQYQRDRRLGLKQKATKETKKLSGGRLSLRSLRYLLFKRLIPKGDWYNAASLASPEDPSGGCATHRPSSAHAHCGHVSFA